MPEGARTGDQQQQPRRLIIYVGVSESQEIAATGQVANFGEPIEVVDKRRVVRHLLDEHGNRYQDVVYPGVASQLLERPDFIEASSDKPKKEEIKEAAEQVRSLSFSDTHGQRRALELAAAGERVDEVVHGEPGYVVVEPGAAVAAGAADQAPQEPVTVPQGQAQPDVQPNPPVNLQPAHPLAQTGEAPGAEVREGDADTDKQQTPGRARPRSGSRTATKRG
jgi:hypothetical protein